MTQTAINYGIVLSQLAIPSEDIESSRDIWNESEPLRKALTSPIVSRKEKEAVIGRIFPQSMQSFFKVVCKYGQADLLSEIFEAYKKYKDANEKVVRATLRCVQEPSEKQLEAIKQKVCKQFNGTKAIIDIEKDASLIGGFVLRVGDIELDESIKGRWKRLSQELTRR